MCGMICLFRFGLGSVFAKTRILFGMSLVGFGSKNAIRFGYYSYYSCCASDSFTIMALYKYTYLPTLFTTHVIANTTATVDDMTLTLLTSLTTTTTSK